MPKMRKPFKYPDVPPWPRFYPSINERRDLLWEALPDDLKIREFGPEGARRWIRAICDFYKIDSTNLARVAGVAPSTINRFLAEAGQENLGGNTIKKIQVAQRKLFKELETDDYVKLRPGHVYTQQKDGTIKAIGVVTETKLAGYVQAGEFQHRLEYPIEDQLTIKAPVKQRYAELPSIGLEVRGPSMNLIYPEGTIVICTPLAAVGRWPVPGERVVVHRYAENGDCEATIKEFQMDEHGRVWLWPRSSDPNFREPISMGIPVEAYTDEETKITFLVIGSMRPEPNFD